MTTPPARGEASRGATVIASLTNGSPWTRSLSNKVPEVSLPFWILTIISTTVGATAADSLSTSPGLGLGMSATTANVSLVVAGVLISQLSLSHYVPGSFWLAVVLVAVLGTLVSDDLVHNLGASPWAATAVFSVSLAVAFAAWRGSEHTVSVHAVLTRRREVWYWLVVLGAFSLGTSVGDLVSTKLALGYTAAGLAFGGVTVLIVVAQHALRLNAVAAFWAAYVVTRPMGSCLGDFLTAPPRDGGLGLGTIATSALLLAALVVVLGLFTARAHHTARHQSGAGQVSGHTV